jgi:hypothetical protein
MNSKTFKGNVKLDESLTYEINYYPEDDESNCCFYRAGEIMSEFAVAGEMTAERAEQLAIEFFKDSQYGLRKANEIQEYMDEMYDRVWFCREGTRRANLIELPENIKAAHDEAYQEILAKYFNNGEELEIDEWQYGYWSGILAALRWVFGDEKDFLDT